MALVQRGSSIKCVIPKLHQLARNHCTGGVIEKSVFISQSTDVHTNMALEEWISKNYDLKNHQIMLFYKNDPCVVLAKTDNPWLDTNIATHPDEEHPVAMARRSGTGDLLYQDSGAANVTFFGCADHFDTDYNMTILKRGLFRKFGLKIQQEKDHLGYGNMIISKSGTTLGETVSYQNCSLFVDVNQTDATAAIEKEKNFKKKSNLLNISEINRKVTSDGVLSAIGGEYLRTAPFDLKDGGKELAARQRGYQMINPTETWFPGITELRTKLSAWNWCYGATPNFLITHSFSIPSHFLPHEMESSELRIQVQVNEGRIGDITLFVPPGLSSTGFTGEAKVITELKGEKFTEEALKKIESILNGSADNDKERFVTECVKRAMISI